MSAPLTSQPMPQLPPNFQQGCRCCVAARRVNINCPPGLEYLMHIDQLLVHQKIELLEVLVGCETRNKYVIKNSMGQQVYYAAEDTDCCTRMCCGSLREFDMKILDNNSREVIHIYRPCRCTGCCYPCCMQEVEVSAPPGRIIGFVKERWSLCIPSFDIQNAAGETVLKLEGPCLTSNCCSDVNFPVYSSDGQTQIGNIAKQWSGLVRETFTKADHFGVNFPMDLDVHIKSVLLGALFLIDFLYFERQN